MLPDDIIFIILDLIEDITDIHNCYFVCKKWKKYIDKITKVTGLYTYTLNHAQYDIMFKAYYPYLFNFADIKYIGRNTDVNNYRHVAEHIKCGIILPGSHILYSFRSKNIRVKINKKPLPYISWKSPCEISSIGIDVKFHAIDQQYGYILNKYYDTKRKNNKK